MHVTFNNTRCLVQFNTYHCGQTAIQLITESGEPMATATAALPKVPVGTDEVLIKDYGENQGVLLALFEAGIVHNPVDAIPVGFAHLLLASLTEKGKRLRAGEPEATVH